MGKSEKPMPPRILLQDALTFNFFRGGWAWTASFDQALDFENVPRALDYALSHRLKRVRVVVKFSHPGYDLELPRVDDMNIRSLPR
jgi:hypothetical protein